MISKEKFVEYLKQIKRLIDNANVLDQALKNFDTTSDFSGFSNFAAIDLTVSMLEDLVGDTRDGDYVPTNIEYFIYDLEFGTKWTEESITESDGTPIDISTPEKLYDYIVKNK